MGGNSFGTLFRVTTFGESHGPALGAVIDAPPPGIELDAEEIQRWLDRRRPGQSAATTQRRESDGVEILSGLLDGRTTGTPLALLIRNADSHSSDYSNLAGLFRPGHADYTYLKKYGRRDVRGGGRSSGRETVARVAAGAVAAKMLAACGIRATAYTIQIGPLRSETFDPDAIEKNIVRAADLNMAAKMAGLIAEAAARGDSVGGVIECRIEGVPPGLGEPVFDKLDAELAKAVMSIGGVKGFEIGDGFASAARFGSENNDPLTPDGFLSNHAGGILGGISNGDCIVFRAAVKPTPSIALPQRTVDTAFCETECRIRGRHDPCLCPRMVPVIEAMALLTIADMLMRQKALGL